MNIVHFKLNLMNNVYIPIFLNAFNDLFYYPKKILNEKYER